MARKRNKMISFHLTEDEYLQWKVFCETANMSQTDMLCHFINNADVINIDCSELRANTTAINRIGANVNQIARRFNMTEIIFDEEAMEILTSAQAAVFENKELLKKIWQSLKR